MTSAAQILTNPGRTRHPTGQRKRHQTTRRARCRRGVSFLELLTSLSILMLVLTMIVQCTLVSGRGFRETERRELARELCNRALESVAATNPSALENELAAIGKRCSTDQHTITVAIRDVEQGARQVHAIAQWKNDQGEPRALQLHFWRHDSDRLLPDGPTATEVDE